MTYNRTPFTTFALGAAVAGLPLMFAGDESTWAKRYIFLVLLGFAVTNWAGLARAANYVSKEVRT